MVPALVFIVTPSLFGWRSYSGLLCHDATRSATASISGCNASTLPCNLLTIVARRTISALSAWTVGHPPCTASEPASLSGSVPSEGEAEDPLGQGEFWCARSARMYLTLPKSFSLHSLKCLSGLNPDVRT